MDMDTLSIFPQRREVDGNTINESPCIKVFEQTLNLVDCAYLINRSSPYLQRAGVIDPDGDQAGQVSDVRTNMSTHLPFHIVDCISRYAELKIGTQVTESLDHSEPMSILRYQKGQKYVPHFDYFDPRLKVSSALLKNGGQRTASAITYLSAPALGGGTSFPKLDLTIPAKTGDTLWFENCDQNGNIDPRSLHAGDVVEEGEKWVVTKWYRQRKTDYLLL